MSAADLLRTAKAHGWEPKKDSWHVRLADKIHHNHVLYVFRHAVVMLDPATRKPTALWFIQPALAVRAKEYMPAVDQVFGRHMALLGGPNPMLGDERPVIAPDQQPPEGAGAEYYALLARAQPQPVVVPVNDSMKSFDAPDATAVKAAVAGLRRKTVADSRFYGRPAGND